MNPFNSKGVFFLKGQSINCKKTKTVKSSGNYNTFEIFHVFMAFRFESNFGVVYNDLISQCFFISFARLNLD